MYEEGEGLDEDESEEYTAMLPKTLNDLPGGGLSNGSMVTVQSQAQHFCCTIILSQEASSPINEALKNSTVSRMTLTQKHSLICSFWKTRDWKLLLRNQKRNRTRESARLLSSVS